MLLALSIKTASVTCMQSLGEVTSHSDILGLWPSMSELARQLTAMGHEISPMGVVRWGQADSIPPKWFPALIQAAEEIGINWLTLALLYRLRSQKEHT